jgi:hypothetical protein
VWENVLAALDKLQGDLAAQEDMDADVAERWEDGRDEPQGGDEASVSHVRWRIVQQYGRWRRRVLRDLESLVEGDCGADHRDLLGKQQARRIVLLHEVREGKEMRNHVLCLTWDVLVNQLCVVCGSTALLCGG